MSRLRSRAILAAVALAASSAVAGLAAGPAHADGYDPTNPAYATWTADQYNAPTPLRDDAVDRLAITGMDATALEVSHYLPAGALHPAQALYQKAQIVNDQEYPVAVHYAGGGDSGSIADYLFEWLSGWQDVTLLPGEATPVFQLQLGMPAAAPNGSQGTSGRYWWQWTLHRVAQPVAEDDSSSTAYQTPITIADLANDHLDDGSALPPGTEITAVVGLTGHGTWTIGRDHTSVVFTPAAGFSGKATARYTIAVPGSGTATAIITVTVGAPPGFAVHTGGSAPAPATASAPGGPLALLRHWLGAP